MQFASNRLYLIFICYLREAIVLTSAILSITKVFDSSKIDGCHWSFKPNHLNPSLVNLGSPYNLSLTSLRRRLFWIISFFVFFSNDQYDFSHYTTRNWWWNIKSVSWSSLKGFLYICIDLILSFFSNASPF